MEFKRKSKKQVSFKRKTDNEIKQNTNPGNTPGEHPFGGHIWFRASKLPNTCPSPRARTGATRHFLYVDTGICLTVCRSKCKRYFNQIKITTKKRKSAFLKDQKETESF